MNSTAVVSAIVYVGATVGAVLVALVIAQGAAKPAHVDHRDWRGARTSGSRSSWRSCSRSSSRRFG